MHRFVFAGCSFTHSGESWAYNPQPYIFPRVEAFMPDELPGTWGEYLLKEQARFLKEMYDIDSDMSDPKKHWSKSKQLPADEYEINIFGRGSNSNTDTARCIMHFIENYEHKIDTVVMQLSGFARRELFTSSEEVIKNAEELQDFNVTKYDDVNFVKHWGAVNYNDVKKDKCNFRKASAYFYSAINEPEEYHIRAIEQLQSLTNFCKVNDIKLGYFHGWENYPRVGVNPQDFNTHASVDHVGINSQYFQKKYKKYVEPYLLSKDSIISYGYKNLDERFVIDLQMVHPDEKIGDTGEPVLKHCGHPSPIAHQKYWNDIVYPFVVK